MLQLHPLIRLDDGRLYCIDLNFLLDKAGRGLYWTLRDAAPAELHKRLPGQYGELFDAYVQVLLKSTTLKKGSYLPSPRFANGDEAFDGCILEGSRLIVLEFKSSVLRADAKYSGDPDAILKEIDKKFVCGDSEGAKGVAQLARGIKKWLEGDEITGINREAIKTIYPVVVVLERAMTVPWMAEYLNQGLRRETLSKFRGKTITPLYVIDIENLERLEPYMERVPLSDMLESYYDANVRRIKRIQYALKPENIPILANIKPSGSLAEKNFSDFRKGMALHLFGIDSDFMNGHRGACDSKT